MSTSTDAVHYLLDTNILVAISKKRPGLAERMALMPAGAIWVSSVVLAEIEYGIVKSTRPELNRQVYDAVLQDFDVIDFGEGAARRYGTLRVDLERRGQIIGPNDLMIAAQALASGAVLVTDKVGEFSRVGGLLMENWLA